MRNPGPNGSAKEMTTVVASGAATWRRLPFSCSAVANDAARVVRRAKRKHHIVGGEGVAVGKGDAGPQLDDVLPAVS